MCHKYEASVKGIDIERLIIVKKLSRGMLREYADATAPMTESFQPWARR